MGHDGNLERIHYVRAANCFSRNCKTCPFLTEREGEKESLTRDLGLYFSFSLRIIIVRRESQS